MSLFVEVFSIEKGSNVIINLDEVIEMAPLIDGSVALFFNDNSGSGSMTSMKVKEALTDIDTSSNKVYNMFKQFVLQTVSADDIAQRIHNFTGNAFLDNDAGLEVEPPKNKGGRPRKNPVE